MIALDGFGKIRPRLAHVVLAAAVGMGCGKERPFSAETAPLEGSSTSATGAGGTPSSSEASASLEGAEAADCPDADCPRGNGGNGTAEAAPSGCTANEDCSSSLTPICDLATGLCVPCIADADCAPERPFCRQTSATSAGNVCVQCTVDTQCPESSPVCDLGSNECTSRCQDSAQCSGATPICDPAQRVCVQCQSSGDCSAPAPACDVATWRCVECLDDSTCAPGRFCNIQSHACVGCLDTSQCTDAFNAHCQTDANAPEPFTCTGCVEDRDCSSKDGLGSHCRTNDGRCVECIADTDCAGSPSTTTCSPEGICGPCVTDADCAGLPGTSICVPGSGCVECESDGDCSNPAAPNCVGGACVACETNGDCAHLDPNGPTVAGGLGVCDLGSCVECTGTQRQACGTNVCNSLTKQCTNRPAGLAGLCDACVSDFECAANARCVAQSFEGTLIDSFCVPVAVAANCDTQRPFVGVTSGTTLDATETTTLCVLRATTCPGLNALGDACVTDDDCGAAGVADGVCVSLAGVNQCTTSCASENDCAGDCPQTTCAL